MWKHIVHWPPCSLRYRLSKKSILVNYYWRVNSVICKYLFNSEMKKGWVIKGLCFFFKEWEMPICTLLMKSAGLYDINYFFTVTPSLTREYNEKRKQWIKIKRYCEVERRVRSYSCTRKTARIGKKESVFMMNSTGIVGIRTQRQPERRVPAQHCIVGSAEVFAMLNPPRVSQYVMYLHSTG